MRLNFRLIFLALLIFLSCSLVNCYKVPTLDVELDKLNGFTVGIPNEQGITTVIFKITINDVCPGIIEYALEPTNNKWLKKINDRSIHNGDNLKIQVAVEHNGQVYEKYEHLKIVNDKILSIAKAFTEHDFNLIKQCEKLEDNEDVKICRPSITVYKKQPPICSGEVIFFEDFNDPKLDTNTWTHEIRSVVQASNSQLVAFLDNDDNSYLKDGKLIIKATWNKDVKKTFDVWDTCTVRKSDEVRKQCECRFQHLMSRYMIHYPPAFSANIHTKKSFNFQYGKVEIRAKLPIGDWLFPYMMLLPMDAEPEDESYDQIRIAYARGHKELSSTSGHFIDGRVLYGDVIYWKDKTYFDVQERVAYNVTQKYENEKHAHYGDDFHNYAITWSKNVIQYEVDGVLYGIVQTRNMPSFNDQEFYIVLGLTVGGELNFDGVQSKWFNAVTMPSPSDVVEFHKKSDAAKTWIQPELQIDYVRVTSIGDNQKKI